VARDGRDGTLAHLPAPPRYISSIASFAVSPTQLVDPEDEDDALLQAARGLRDAELDDPHGNRLRHLPMDVEWPAETNAERELRRRRLAECDDLLGAIEAHNVRNAKLHRQDPVPGHLIAWYHALGGARRAVRRGEALIEAVFELQRPCVRRPILPEEPPFPRPRIRRRSR